MKQIINYNTRLKFQSNNDKQKIVDLLQICRDAFNFCSELHFGAKKNSIVELHSKAYYPIRNRFGCKAQVAAAIMREVIATYKAIKTHKAVLKEAVQRKKSSITLSCHMHRINGNIIKLTTMTDRVSGEIYLYPKLQEMFDKYRVLSPKLFIRDNEVWIKFPFEINIIKQKSNLSIGIDLGIRRIATTSEGKIYQDKKYLANKRKLRYLKRCLRAKNTKSAKKHLKQLKRTEGNRTRNFVHSLVNKILKTKANIIVLEELNIRKMKRKVHKNQKKNRVSQIPFGLVKSVLTYKAALAGKQVVCVNPAYTSQIDCITGKMGDRQGCRFYSKSGLIYDADVNAAVNIAKLAQLPFLYDNLLEGQAFVSKPIVGRYLPPNKMCKIRGGSPRSPVTTSTGILSRQTRKVEH